MRRYEDTAGGSQEHESMGERMKNQARDAGDQVRDKANEAKEKASAAGERVKQQARSAGEQAKDTTREKAREATDEARARVNEFYETAKNHVNEMAEEQKSRLTAGIGSVAAAIRCASNQLRDDGLEPADRWIESVAQQVDSCRDYVDGRQALDMLGEVRTLAKRYPYLLVGAAFVTGIGIARFIKASEQRNAGAYESGHTEGYYGSPGDSERRLRKPGSTGPAAPSRVTQTGAPPSTPRQSTTTPPRPSTGQTASEKMQSQPRPTDQE